MERAAGFEPATSALLFWQRSTRLSCTRRSETLLNAESCQQRCFNFMLDKQQHIPYDAPIKFHLKVKAVSATCPQRPQRHFSF